jgi:hypothetical protein
MRRLTVVLMAIGCLVLLVTTIPVTSPVSAAAQPVFGEGDCQIDPDCPGGVDKVVVCHIDESGKEHPLCVNEEAFTAHVVDLEAGHNKDFCFVTEVAPCGEKK